MTKKELREIIENLEDEDKALLREAERLLKEMNRVGGSKATYRLSPPAGSSRAKIVDDPDSDPRFVRLPG